MPRYRFAWGNFPPALLKKLATTLKVEGPPADGLRRKFGARPKADFVQKAWPVLLADWLPSDGPSRNLVVERLRSAGLGDTSMPTRGKQSQLDYLSTCRNSPTLREAVLRVFLRAGEPTTIAAPAARRINSTPESPPQSPPSTDAGGGSTAPAPAGAPSDFPSWVEAVLKDQLGLKEVYRDEDGDIPIPRGSAVAFIRTFDKDSPFLEIFSPLVRDLEITPDVYEAVNAINAQLAMAKATAFSESKQIILSVHVLIDTLSVKELMFALDWVSSAADHFDTLLQKRFGGTTLLKDDDGAIEV